MLSAGQPAPEIRLNDLSGAPVSLGVELQGGPVLLAFFKVSCPTCQFTFPFLQRFADAGMRVIGISQDNSSATASFRDSFRLQFPLWLDSIKDGYAASNAYRITNVPSLFLVGQDGRIIHAGAGFARQDFVEIGNTFDFVPFHADETVPAFKPG